MKGMRFGRRFRVILFGFIIIFALTGIQVSLKAGLIGKTPTKGRPKPKPKPKPPKSMNFLFFLFFFFFYYYSFLDLFEK